MTCLICDKPFKIFMAMSLDPPICSEECLQRKLDQSGIVYRLPDGTEIEVKPGNAKVISRKVAS